MANNGDRLRDRLRDQFLLKLATEIDKAKKILGGIVFNLDAMIQSEPNDGLEVARENIKKALDDLDAEKWVRKDGKSFLSYALGQ